MADQETQPIALKPAWQTSEFWLASIPAFVAILGAVGLIGPDQTNDTEETLKILILGVFAAVTIVSQIHSRSKLKEEVVKANAEVIAFAEVPKEKQGTAIV